MKLEQIIKKSEGYYVNSDLTSENFPKPDIIETTGAKIIKMEKSFSSQEALDEIKRQGCRPANAWELAKWANEHGEEMDKETWIVALGQIWKDSDGDHGVPFVYRHSDGDFRFNLGYFEGPWDGGGCLLGFPVESFKKIKAFSGEEIIVDSEDYDELSKYKWSLSHGYPSRSFTENGKKTAIRLHQMVNKTPKGFQTDHINRNKLDNRKENLRTVTWSENQLNTGLRVDNKSGEKGISKKGKNWQVHLKRDKKKYFLGNFDSLEEAVIARNSFCTALTLEQRVAKIEKWITSGSNITE